MSTTASGLKHLQNAVSSGGLPDGPILAAFSGGLDSSVLLDLLRRFRPDTPLYACHVNHGIRPPDPNELEGIKAFCAERDIPLYDYTIAYGWLEKQSQKRRLSLEDLARSERYRRLHHRARLIQASTIALAQHQDDQVETFVMRLLQGSGPIGLSGMQVWNPPLWRPLLGISRRQLSDYARQFGIRYFEDPSNRDPRFFRNLLRWKLLPKIGQIYPNYQTGFLRSQKHFRIVSEWLSAERDRLAEQIIPPQKGAREYCWPGSLPSLPRPLQIELIFLLFDWISHREQRRKRLPLGFILELLRQWENRKTGNLVQLRTRRLLWRIGPDAVRVSETGPEPQSRAI